MFIKGYKQTEAHKRKIGLANSISQKGRKLSEKTKRKMSESGEGKHFYWKGKKMDETHKNKMSESGKGKHTKEKCNFWKGGISFEPYSIDWTDYLRETIRKRDEYVCQLCGIYQDELERKLDCHHIDYDKKNCDPKNLITLCRDCHRKTNDNRDYWTDYFKIIIE